MSTPKAVPTAHENIYRRGDGYLVRVRLGPKVKPYTKTWPTLKEAKDDRDRVLGLLAAGKAVPSGRATKVTVGEMAADFIATGEPDWSYKTVERYRCEWRHLEPYFGHRPVTALKPSEVAEWQRAELRRTKASTVRQKRRTLSAILDHAALVLDLDLPNPTKVAKLKRTKRQGAPKAERRFTYTAEQMATALAAVKPRYRVVFLLCLALGLRSGEARGLTLDRVDFTTGAVVIDRQLLKVKRGHQPKDVDLITDSIGFAWLKTDASYGTVFARDLLDAIAEHVATYGTGPDGLIATSVSGGPLPESTWTHEVTRVARETGVDFSGHDLRHTFGSWLHADPTKSVAEAAAAMRHDPLTFLRTYAHAEETESPKASDAVMAKLAGITPEPEPTPATTPEPEVAPAARTPRAERHLRAVS